jgi:hypothetical protein
MTAEIKREFLIAKLSWWAGICIDKGETDPDMVLLHGLLLEAKHQIAMDRKATT